MNTPPAYRAAITALLGAVIVSACVCEYGRAPEPAPATTSSTSTSTTSTTSTTLIRLTPHEEAPNVTATSVTSTSSTTSTTATLVSSVTLGAKTVDKMMACHASEGAACYQSGFDDSCDYMLSLAGLKANRFRSGPPKGYDVALGRRPNDTITFAVDPVTNTFRLNASIYPMELRRSGHPKSLAILNMTYGNGTLREGYEWTVHLR